MSNRESVFRNLFLVVLYYSIALLFLLPIFLSVEFIPPVAPIPDPNSFTGLSYRLLSVLLQRPAAEKLMAGLQVLLFLVIFRNCILSLNPRAIYRPFLIFPFVFHLSFVSGNFNFSWGIVWWMASLLMLIKLPGSEQLKKYPGIWFFVLSMGCCLSDPLAFLLMVGMSLAWIVFQRDKSFRKKLLINWIVGLLPSLLLCFKFRIDFDFSLATFPSIVGRLYSLLSCETIVTFEESERLFTWPVGVIITGLIIFALIKIFRPVNAEPERLLWQRILTFTALFFTLAFFVFPATLDTESALPVKFQLVSILCILMVIATIRLKKVWMIPLGIIFLTMSVARLRQQVMTWGGSRVAAIESSYTLDDSPTIRLSDRAAARF